MNDNERVVLLIEQLMKDHGLTREQLSEAIGYQPQTLTSLISKGANLAGAARKLQRALESGTLKKTAHWRVPAPFYAATTHTATIDQLRGISRDAIQDTVNVPLLDGDSSFVYVAGNFYFNSGEVVGLKPTTIDNIRFGFVYLLVTMAGNTLGVLRQGRRRAEWMVYPTDESVYDPLLVKVAEVMDVFEIIGVIKYISH